MGFQRLTRLSAWIFQILYCVVQLSLWSPDSSIEPMGAIIDWRRPPSGVFSNGDYVRETRAKQMLRQTAILTDPEQHNASASLRKEVQMFLVERIESTTTADRLIRLNEPSGQNTKLIRYHARYIHESAIIFGNIKPDPRSLYPARLFAHIFERVSHSEILYLAFTKRIIQTFDWPCANKAVFNIELDYWSYTCNLIVVGAYRDVRSLIRYFIRSNHFLRGATSVFYGLQGSVQRASNEPQGDRREDHRRGADYSHEKSPKGHVLLGVQILLCAGGFLASLYLFIYTFQHGRRFSSDTGALRVGLAALGVLVSACATALVFYAP